MQAYIAIGFLKFPEKILDFLKQARKKMVYYRKVTEKEVIPTAKGQKAAPRSLWAETTRKKQNDWIKQNRLNLVASVPKETGETFRTICKNHGRSVSSVLASYVQAVVAAGDLVDVPQDRNAQTQKTD